MMLRGDNVTVSSACEEKEKKKEKKKNLFSFKGLEVLTNLSLYF